jgi:hypothetical protein
MLLLPISPLHLFLYRACSLLILSLHCGCSSCTCRPKTRAAKMASTQNPLFVPLFLLEDPPKDYQPDKFAEDTWRVTEWRAIVDYHGYGFAYEMPITKAKIISVFKKISHNTRGGKQACCTGDVGPGLLKDGLLAKFGLQMPQATWTVTEANIQNYFTIPAYLRNAPVPRSKRSNNPILIKTKSGFPTITYLK